MRKSSRQSAQGFVESEYSSSTGVKVLKYSDLPTNRLWRSLNNKKIILFTEKILCNLKGIP